jgi:hypothetical protein
LSGEKTQPQPEEIGNEKKCSHHFRDGGKSALKHPATPIVERTTPGQELDDLPIITATVCLATTAPIHRCTAVVAAFRAKM